MEESALSKRLTALYDDIITYKSHQPTGAACSQVYTLYGEDKWDYDGLPSYYGQDFGSPSNYVAPFKFYPVFDTTDYSSAVYFVDGWVGDLPLKTVAEAGAAHIANYHPEKGDIQFNAPDDIPGYRTVFLPCGSPMRYIKVGINGNSVNNYNHWVEIMALTSNLDTYFTGTAGGTNVARQATVTAQNVSSTTNIQRVIDGDTSSSNYYEGGANGYSTVTLDLGSVRYINEIWVYLYYADGRYYKQFTVSTGLSNVAGTADLEDVWVDKINSNDYSRNPAEYVPWVAYGGDAGQLTIPPKDVKLRGYCRAASPGYLNIETWGT